MRSFLILEKSNGDKTNADMKMKLVGGEENHTDAVKSDAAEMLTSEIKELKVTILKLEEDNSDLRDQLCLTNASNPLPPLFGILDHVSLYV